MYTEYVLYWLRRCTFAIFYSIRNYSTHVCRHRHSVFLICTASDVLQTWWLLPLNNISALRKSRAHLKSYYYQLSLMGRERAIREWDKYIHHFINGVAGCASVCVCVWRFLRCSLYFITRAMYMQLIKSSLVHLYVLFLLNPILERLLIPRELFDYSQIHVSFCKLKGPNTFPYYHTSEWTFTTSWLFQWISYFQEN